MLETKTGPALADPVFVWALEGSKIMLYYHEVSSLK
jgi:hypothetical protein